MALEHWLTPHLDPGAHECYQLGDFPLVTGYTLLDAKIAYRTRGDLKSTQGRAILFPHQFTGTTESMDFFTHPGRPLDPAKYFTIFPGAFSHGESSSPSNTPSPFNQGAFPPITYVDDVRAQYELVTKHFGIEELYAVLGWSGGGIQTYEWAVSHPAMVKRAAIFSGFAKASTHSLIIGRLFQDAIRSDSAWNNGFYPHRDAVQLGLRRLARANSLVSVTPEFYRQEVWREVGYSSAEDFIVRTWEQQFLTLDPNNLLGQIDKWSMADVSVHAHGDLAAALGKIRAKTFVIPFTGDRFITREDCEADAALIPNAQLRPIDSIWGHTTMLSPMEEDMNKIDQVLQEVLA